MQEAVASQLRAVQAMRPDVTQSLFDISCHGRIMIAERPVSEGPSHKNPANRTRQKRQERDFEPREIHVRHGIIREANVDDGASQLRSQSLG